MSSNIALAVGAKYPKVESKMSQQQRQQQQQQNKKKNMKKIWNFHTPACYMFTTNIVVPSVIFVAELQFMETDLWFFKSIGEK